MPTNRLRSCISLRLPRPRVSIIVCRFSITIFSRVRWRPSQQSSMRRANKMETRYKLIGSTASPYAIKLRALMRYRRIPFDWIIMTKALRKQTEHLRPNLIPVLQYPGGTFRGETTTLAYDLEARHSERSVIPQDTAVAFICDLLEDLADEWAVHPLL